MSDQFKKIFFGFIAVILLIVVISLLMMFVVKKKQPTTVQTQTSQNNLVKKQDVDVNKNPEKFPADIPIESGAKITQNYNATAQDGRFQATRVFETKKTLDENLTIYKNYLSKAGYKVQSTVDQNNYKMIFGTKDEASLQISIDNNTAFNIKTVSINYTETPTAPKKVETKN